MNAVKNLIETYSSQFTEALNEKQLEKASAIIKEFKAEVGKLANPTESIASELEIFATNESHKMLGMWLSAAELRPSPKYLEALCAILEQENGSYICKSIIDVLNAIRDERAIPCLEQALRFDIDYDSAKDLSVNALIALGEIGTPKAREAIQNCLNSPHSKIRDDARLGLRVLEQQNSSG
jgi:HEAT repeat protein